MNNIDFSGLLQMRYVTSLHELIKIAKKNSCRLFHKSLLLYDQADGMGADRRGNNGLRRQVGSL